MTPAFGKLIDAAQYLGTSTKTVRRLIASGLPAYRLGESGHLRVRLADLDRWLEENCRVENDVDALVDQICEGLR